MTLCNPTKLIISQAITIAVDGVLAKSQHELRGLLRDLCETTAHVFIQHQQRRTTLIFEEDDEDDVSESLAANRNHDQTEAHALEDPHDQFRDFVGAPIYDVYDDELSTAFVYDFCRESRHKSDLTTQEGDTPAERSCLSLLDNHGINNMRTETLFDRPIFTSDVDSYYIPVTNLTDEPIYDASDDEVLKDSHYCIDPLFNDEDEVQGLCVHKEHINYVLGEKDCDQQFHRKPPDRRRHKELTNGSEYPKLLDKTRRILKLAPEQEDWSSELSLIQKQALENRITYLQEALALEKEKNKNLEQELKETHKKIRMLNKGSANLDKILTMGRTEKSTMGLGYQGDSSNSQTVFVHGKSAEPNKTRVVLSDELSGPVECIDAHRCLQTEIEFPMEPVYGVCKEEIWIQNECNELDFQQRESLQFPMSRCGLGVNKIDGETIFSPSHDIVKLESMDKKHGHMWLIENSAHGSFSLSLSDDITSEEEEARGYTLASVFLRMQEANTLTTYHEQLLCLWCKKSDSLDVVLISCCSTFYGTSVVVSKTTAALVFIHASVSLHVSFSWIIHIMGTLERAAAFQTALQKRLLIILVKGYHCTVFQPSIIWESWVWILLPPLVDDASRRETDKAKSKVARRDEILALDVMECLNFRARHDLVLSRFFVHACLTRCFMDKERCNLGILRKFLLLKRHVGFYRQHGCASLVCFFLSRFESYRWCVAHFLHWSFSSRAENLHEGSNYKDTTIVCWNAYKDVACISSKSLFWSIFGASRECFYSAVISSGFPLLDLLNLVNQRVQGFICVVPFSPSHVSPMGYCWILVIMDKVPCYCGLSVDRWDHTFSIILNISVGGFVFFMEHSIKDVELQLVQVKKSISVAYYVRRFLFHRGICLLFIFVERKMFSIERRPWSSLALETVSSHIHLFPFISSFHKLHRGVFKREFDVVLLMDLEFVVVILATRSEQVDGTVVSVLQSPTFRVGQHENNSLCGFMIAFVLLCDCFRGDLVYDLVTSGPLALGVARDFSRNSAHAMEFESSYGKQKARKMEPLEIKHLFKFGPDVVLLFGFVDESLKGGGT